MRLERLFRGIEPIAITGHLGTEIDEVTEICYDSRQCRSGSLFVAIPGLKVDGRAFIADALSKGARFVVHEGDWDAPARITAVRVGDSRRALGLLAKNFFANPSAYLCLIGVVGTNGKTTLTYLLESILQAAGRKVGILGTVNYRYDGRQFPAPNTTPESFEMQRILREMADHGVTHCVAEVSSHAIHLHRVDDCAFALGIFTNLTQDHLDYHGTMENYFQAKRRFFSEVLPAGGSGSGKRMIVNADDPWGCRLLRESEGVITYGLDAACDVTADPYRLSLEGIEATLHLGGKPLAIRSPLLGRFNLYNILAAAAAAETLGIPGEAIRDGLAQSHVPGRLEKVSAAGQPAVFVDYAHTDDALRRVIETLTAFRKKRLITLFGCGGDRDRGKRPLMGEAAAAISDLTIVTSDNPRTEDPGAIIAEIEKGIAVRPFQSWEAAVQHTGRRGYLRIPNRKEAILRAVALAEAEDIVLIAGKGHEDYQIIGTEKFPFDDRKLAREALVHWQENIKMTAGDNGPILAAATILAATKGRMLQGSVDWSCRGLSTDTRTLQTGNLFVALNGERFNGHDYLAAAAERGASGLLIAAGQEARLETLPRSLPVIAVTDPLTALGAMAREWRQHFAAPVLAITGSAGKTTTKEMILAIASQSRPVLATAGNLNNQIGLPLTLLRLRPEHSLAIVEMGTSSPGEIAKLTAIALPEIGLITNIGPAHLEGLGSIEAVREEKGALFTGLDSLGTAIVNHDDPQVRLLAERRAGKAIRFGLEAGAEVTAAKISGEGPEGIGFILLIAGNGTSIRLAVPGRHNVKNALAAAAAATALGFSLEEIAAGLAAFRPVPGRMEIIALANGVHLIMDAYNANPASVREALHTLQALKGKGRSFAILGDMLELGEETARLHEGIGSLAAETGVERLFLKGAFTGHTSRGAREKGFAETKISPFTDSGEIAAALKENLKPGDWILVKGSRKMKLETVKEGLIALFDLRP